MGVLARLRSVSQIQYLACATKLEIYTIKRASHDIPKAYSFTLKNPLCESARRINQYVTSADSTMMKPGDAEAYERRIQFLGCAYREARNMFEILRVCDEVLPIKETVLEEWSKLIIDEQMAIAAEKKSLRDRFEAKD